MQSNPNETSSSFLCKPAWDQILREMDRPGTASYVVHLAGGFVVVVVAEARNRGHVVVVFAFGPRLVRRLLARVLLDVLCDGPALEPGRASAGEGVPETHP